MNKLQDLYNLYKKSKDTDDFNQKVYRRVRKGTITQDLFMLYLELTQTRYVGDSMKSTLEAVKDLTIQ